MQKFYDCGIDLGTTNSCIATPTGDNSCVIIENTQDRMQVTPSAVAIDKRGRMLVGQRAKSVKECATCFKRKMGTEDVITFTEANVSKTPEELSSEVLKLLKRDAESRLSEEMNDVVITVPAAFSSLQNEATKKAASLAGFRNVILLQEPIAAAIAYGAKPDSKEQYWMVFDYGGGTLDVSILSTHDGRLTVINSEGDNYCGGSDIDRLMVDKIIKPKLQEEYNIDNNLYLENVMKSDMEARKIELSSAESTLFEVFDRDDNDGNPIEFEYEITRAELEELITPTVDRCIDIAKKALDGAKEKDGIDSSKISKILLVGGSTFIPLVRNKLKEAFDIELDCSLNPMTVVAEGAAIYAATCIAEVEDQINDENAENPILNIQYEPISSNTSVNIVGNIQNIGSHKIDKIKIDSSKSDDASGAIWTSGWVEFMDAETGLFDIDVELVLKGSNKFTAFVCDKTGREIKVENNTFEIRYNDNALKVSNPPATFSVCVMVTDGQNNILAKLIEKNTPLPADGIKAFRTTKELNPNVGGSIDIQVWEGEIYENPHANHYVGSVHVQASAMDRVLPVGTEIEIKITQDISRLIHVTGYIPDADYEIPEETLRDDSERISLYERMDEIKKEIAQLNITLNKLSDNDIDTSDFEEKLNTLKSQYDEIYGCIDVDSDKVQLYIKEFYELHTAILSKERTFEKESHPDEERENIGFWRENIDRFADEETKSRFQELYNGYQNSDNDANKQYYYDEMSNQNFETITGSIEFMSGALYDIINNDSIQYTDNQKAEYWKTKGMDAIREKNLGAINEAVGQLFSLRIGSANDSTNSIIADLRI